MCSSDVDVMGKGGRTFMVKLRSVFGKLWHKEGPGKQVQHERVPRMVPPQIASVATMTEQLKQLKIQKSESLTHSESDEDDIVVTKVTTVRHSSNDSGYFDKNDDDDDSFKTVQVCVTKTVEGSPKNEQISEKAKDGDFVEDSAKNLNNGDCKKPKQLKKVFLSRQPIRTKAQMPAIGPYASRPQQFHQVNHQSFSGCQVTVNQALQAETTTSDIETIRNNLLNQTHFAQTPNPDLTIIELEQTWGDLFSIIKNDIAHNEDITNFITGLVTQTDNTPTSEELNTNMGLTIPFFGTSDPSVFKNTDSAKVLLNGNLEPSIPFGDSNPSVFNGTESDQLGNLDLVPNIQYNSNKEPPFNSQPPVYENPDLGFDFISNDLNSPISSKPALFLTPPPSNESAAPSPNNRSKSDFESMYSPNRDYSSDISTRHCPAIFAECEVFQAIPTEDIPKCVEAKITEKTKEKNKGAFSMNLKQYREVMKKMEAGFAGLPCCKGQDSAEDLSKACSKKLSPEDRRQMSLALASCSLETAYGLLYKLLESLSTGHDREHYLYATFLTICNRIRDEKPELYLSEFGLDLLAACCLVCPARHRLARHVVSCVRAALEGVVENERRICVFDTVDTNGDNLVGACARRGDECALVLYELTNHGPGETPLFHVDHVNSEGLSALHLACSCDDAASRAQAAHVLLSHSRADIWKKDIKSGDLPLHHAITSAAAFPLTMCLFLHLDNDKWFSLAKAKNYSSQTPLLKAKKAADNTANDSPIHQVYRFLAKCRPKTTSTSSDTYHNASY